VLLSDITPSIFASLGLQSATDRLQIGTSPHGREILLLIDGLGNDALLKYAEHAPHIARLSSLSTLQTSFPSTTSTSLATLTTGELPGIHGMVGYTVAVPRSGGRILNALKWDERVDPQIWQPVPTLFERGTHAGIRVSHVAAKRYEGTGFTRAVFRGAEYQGANIVPDLIARTVEALTPTPSFVYLYMNDVDVAGHSDGVGSEKWIAALTLVDSLVAGLFDAAPAGTRLWLTADHGMINATRTVVLGDNNPLLDQIAITAGEPRARHMYLAPTVDSEQALAEVKSAWEEFLGDDALVHTRQSAIASGLFGARVTDDAAERIGDLVILARNGVILVDPTRTHLEAPMMELMRASLRHLQHLRFHELQKVAESGQY